MKLSRFGHETKRKSFEKLAKFRPKYRLFMSWSFWIKKYFFRLFKELRIILPVFFIGVLILNLFFPKTNFRRATENLLLNPADGSSRKILVNEFLMNNDFDSSLKESREDSRKIFQLRNRPQEIRQEINFWQNTTELYPNYRDAYVRLAILNYNIYNNYLARLYLEKAKEIDPTLSLEFPL